MRLFILGFIFIASQASAGPSYSPVIWGPGSSVEFLASHMLTTGTVTTVTSCGSTPSVIGNDSAGTITVGTGGVATACTLNFAVTWIKAPHCFVADQTQIIALQIAPGTTSLTITALAALSASSKLDYFCVSHQ